MTAAGCSSTTFEAAEVKGAPAMVDDAGQPRLWVLSKQEERRQIAVGGVSRRTSTDWRTDTFFHFSVQAIDPISTKTVWKQRLRTFGDDEATGSNPSRVIGSAVSARLLGQEGPRVWLLIGDEPMVVSAHDGQLLADAAGLEARNPTLKGLLPSEAKHYGFDDGLVLMSADARQFVVRGDKLQAQPYTLPPPRNPWPKGQMLADGTEEMVPMPPPLGEPPPRQAMLGSEWIGLYSEKEAAEIARDESGKTLRYPYSVSDEGSLARRTFWRAKIVPFKDRDNTFQRLTELKPIPGAPTFLKGRFINEPDSDRPMKLEGTPGLLVIHSTRMDAAGRVMLARLDANLKKVWRTELPFSETNLLRNITKWRLPGHLVAVGEKEYVEAGVTHREPWIASVALDTGAMQVRKLTVEED
ncbi:MAG: PA2928 family protein [Thermomonas sp.]